MPRTDRHPALRKATNAMPTAPDALLRNLAAHLADIAPWQEWGSRMECPIVVQGRP